MGLFVRRQNDSIADNLYNAAHGNVLLIVGLGNVGTDYDNTRHNIGFFCIDGFAEQHSFPVWSTKKNLHCSITKQVIGNTMVILVKPTTFMNQSGQAVSKVQQYFKIRNTETVVVHDEIDLQFGLIRARTGGGAAGHNGIKSIIQHCGDDFLRVRVGIHNENANTIDSADFVLAKFNKEEQSNILKLYREVSTILSEYTASHVLPHETRNFLL